MNGGYYPAVETPTITAKKQMATNHIPFYQGGSQIPTALGFIPTIPEVKPKNVTIKKNPKK